MIKHRITMSVIAATVAFSPVNKAAADAGDAIVGGIIGGVIGGAIVNEGNKKRQTKKVYVQKPRSSVSAATRAQNREVQTSLNYFGFPAGTPDGVMGRNSRAAVGQYQAFLGYPPSGYLTVYERDFLTTSYHRAIAGGATTTQLVAGNPLGTRGLLKTYQQAQTGGAVNTVPVVTQVVPAQPVPQPAPQVVPQTTTVVVAPQPVPSLPTTTPVVTEAPTAAALPSFMAQSGGGVSLASHCNKVNLLTSTNGGFVTEASMSDANQALNEQFCVARTYAIAQGEDLIAKVPGFTPDQIAKQCESFGPVLKEHVEALSLKSEAEVLQGVGAFVQTSGMAPAQLSGTAKICLSVGYRTDNMNVAIGSALILVALGERVYGELPGHHLSQGIGASQRADLSVAWYQMSFDALAQGATPVFAPGQPERNGLLKKAAYSVGQPAQGAANTGGVATPVPAVLPNFAVQN